MNDRPATVVFAGGGSGGHIFPNLAVIERLRDMGLRARALLLVSDRELDQQIAREVDDDALDYVILPAHPLRKSPGGVVRFVLGYQRSVRQVRELFRAHDVRALVSTGGFVGGPAVAAAAGRVPSALVNLDAVPGRANQLMARRADQVFSAYREVDLPGAEWIGMPVRRSVVSDATAGEARRALGLAPERPTLLVTAGSQGARSINEAMIALCARAAAQAALNGWQVLHLSGSQLVGEIEQAYAQAMVPARVVRFLREMGLAWSAASIALSRAGAGGVAEAWANRVPTVFMPYPYHRDEHQRHNAEPMVATGGAVLVRDAVEAEPNAEALEQTLLPLLRDEQALGVMRARLAEGSPPDGAEAVAQWVAEAVTPQQSVMP